MDDELYAFYPYYSYAASSSDFTTSTSPPQHHLLSPLPPPPNTSLISSSNDDFASFHNHNHYDHQHHPMLFGSVSEVRLDDAASVDFSSDLLRARIAAHPLYSRLLQAYIDCQKVIIIASSISPNAFDCSTF